MFVTLFGMLTLVSLLQEPNKFFLMSVNVVADHDIGQACAV